MKKLSKLLKILLILLILAIVVIFIYHQIKLKLEEHKLKPLGEIVEVNNKNMSVFVKGTGNKTIVFLAGGGTCSPILDFKSLVNQLSDEYKIVIIEKFGYGFSDDADGKRDIATILEESREALKKLNIEGPYVLAAHSMSGIQALYWAQQYPGEVEKIIGLDMAVPEIYHRMSINPMMLQLVHLSSQSGIIRVIPGVSESDAIKHGILTDQEKEIYRALFYKRTMNKTMVQENKDLEESIHLVEKRPYAQVPTLLLVSTGEGTTLDQNSWRSMQINFSKQMDESKVIFYDVPHYLHDYKYKEMAQEIKLFLEK